MDRQAIEQALDAANASVEAGRGLGGTGFWKAVAQLRKDGALAEEFSGRVAELDRRAFEAGVKLRVPAALGTAALTCATGIGIGALAVASGFESRPVRTAVFLGAFGALEVSTHSLAHWAVGRMLGMRFTHYFLGGPPPPKPGAKLDYTTYLAVPPAQRALMHASGAVVTKIVPFALIPVSRSLDLYEWVTVLLLVIGAGQIATDVLFSTKSSDWKKVRRELKAAKNWTPPAGKG